LSTLRSFDFDDRNRADRAAKLRAFDSFKERCLAERPLGSGGRESFADIEGQWSASG
jgi:hypothetical protein